MTAGRLGLDGAHRTADETPGEIDFAIVETVGRMIRFRIDKEIGLSSFAVKRVEARLKRHQRRAAPAQRHRTDDPRDYPARRLRASRRAAKASSPEAVDGIEPLAFDVPNRPLAERRFHVNAYLDPQRLAPSEIAPLQ